MGAQPLFIGIAGGSCSGKTWLATRLHEQLGKECGTLSLDDFYKDRSDVPLEERGKINFDDPEAIDWERLEEVLSAFRKERPARIPRYDFATHTRMEEEPFLRPTRLLIVEGIWPFHVATVREMFGVKIFLRSDLGVCEARRIDRDVRERGRNAKGVREQFQTHTIPMYEKFVVPQEKWADVVLPAEMRQTVVEQLAKMIRNKLENSKVSL